MTIKEHGGIKRELKMMHWHKVSFVLLADDFIAVCFAYFAGLWLRFDGRFSMIPREYLEPYAQFIVIYAAICIVVFTCLRL